MDVVVEDDCTKMGKITRKMVMDKSECETLKDYTGLKNAIVHRYNHLNMKYVERGMAGIDELCSIVAKLAGVYERLEAA